MYRRDEWPPLHSPVNLRWRAADAKMVPVPLRIREYHRADVTLKGTAVSVRGERNGAEGFRWAKMAAALPLHEGSVPVSSEDKRR